ncbi:MAG: biopolymer transporter ExbD [Kofleriaceae bacterium]
MAGKLPDESGDEDDGGGGFAEINITPLTDVFLVMVIIFMVSAVAVQSQATEATKAAKAVVDKAEVAKKAGLAINLPTSAAQQIDVNKASLVLVVPVEGDIAVDGKLVRDADLDNLFRGAFVRDKGTQVVFQADKDAAYGRVVDIMARANAAGLTSLAIATAGGK